MSFKFSDDFVRDVNAEFGEDFSACLGQSLENPEDKGYEFVRAFLSGSRVPPSWETVLKLDAVDLIGMKVEADRQVRRQALYARCLQERSTYETTRIRQESTA